jgi:hypothetical protein
MASGHPTNAHIKLVIANGETRVSVVMNINGTMVEQPLAGVAGSTIMLLPTGGFCDVRLAPQCMEIITDAGEEAAEAENTEGAEGAAGRPN